MSGDRVKPLDMDGEAEELIDREYNLEEKAFAGMEAIQKEQYYDTCTLTYRCSRQFWGVVLKGLLCPMYCLKYNPAVEQIEQGNAAVVTSFGRFEKVKPPGAYIKNVCTESYYKVNMKTQMDNVSSQSLLTSDNVNIRIDAVVYYQIQDAYKAIFRIKSYKEGVSNTIQSALKNIIGEHKMQEVLDQRKMLDSKLARIVDTKTHAYGIRVFTIEIKEIFIPGFYEESNGDCC